MGGRLKGLVKRVASALGVWYYVRAIRYALEPPARHQERQDHEHLALLIGFLLDADDSCVDIGSNRGVVLEKIMETAPLGHHIAYEPLPHLHRELSERFPDVDVRQAAVADERGTASFNFVQHEDGLSGLRDVDFDSQHEAETFDVPVETLDDSLPDGYAPRLIKMDVEGAEYRAMKGAARTIRTHKPVLVFEFWKEAAAAYGDTAADVFDLLCGDFGMRLFDMDANGPYSREQFEHAVDAGIRENFIAHW